MNNRPIIRFTYSSRLPTGFVQHLRSHQLPHENLSITDTITQSYICKICERKFFDSDLASLNLCVHKFCKNCLIEYAVYKINVHEVVLCPEENCPEKLAINSLIYSLLPEKVQNKFQEHELWRQTM